MNIAAMAAVEARCFWIYDFGPGYVKVLRETKPVVDRPFCVACSSEFGGMTWIWKVL